MQCKRTAEALCNLCGLDLVGYRIEGPHATLYTAASYSDAVLWIVDRYLSSADPDGMLGRAMRARRPEIRKACAWCGESFTATDSRAETCSDRCRKARQRARAKE